MEVEDYFDPVDFYTNDDPPNDQIPTPTKHTNINSENSAVSVSVSVSNEFDSQKSLNSLRRSGRPKPPAETLISSPPAIKFYESTVIRKNSRSSSSSSSKISRTVEETEPAALTMNNSKVLKLKLTSPPSAKGSKENLDDTTPKRGLRVVKLMMPDVTEDENQPEAKRVMIKSPEKNKEKSKKSKVLNNEKSKKKSKFSSYDETFKWLNDEKSKFNSHETSKSNSHEKSKFNSHETSKFNSHEKLKFNSHEKLRELPLLAPKPPTELKLRERRALKSEESSDDIKAFPSSHVKIEMPTVPKRDENIVNEDVCSSCGGLGNFICCDACPRSFHFTCAEPPLDPQNLPQGDWYCNECRHSASEPTDSSDIWSLMTHSAKKMNPKCFVMPRRFRFQPKDEDILKLQTGQLFPSVSATAQNQLQSQQLQTSFTIPGGPLIIDETIKIDHCGHQISAPNILHLKSPTGYCHCCGRFGLTKAGQAKVDELNVPGDPSYHRPMLACAICPLYWHLDCLDPPMVNYPSPSTTWTCPIHFTSEQCLALDLVEELVQASALLPESAIRLQFKHKVDRMHSQPVTPESDEEEKFYRITNGVKVPDSIKLVYQ